MMKMDEIVCKGFHTSEKAKRECEEILEKVRAIVRQEEWQEYMERLNW